MYFLYKFLTHFNISVLLYCDVDGHSCVISTGPSTARYRSGYVDATAVLCTDS